MSFVKQVKQNNFLCKWRVENYLYILYEEGESIYSPTFVIRQLRDTQWRLCLKVCEETFGNSISFGLVRVDASAPKKAKIYFEMSVIANDGSVSETITKSYEFSKNYRCPDQCLIDFSLDTLHGKNKSVSSKEALTIYCTIPTVEYNSVDSMQWFARTCIAVHRKPFLLSVDFHSMVNTCLENSIKEFYVLRFATEEMSPLLNIHVPWNSPMRKLKMEVSRKPCARQFLTYHISMLDTKGNRETSDMFGILHEDKKIKDKTLCWRFEFGLPVDKILQMKNKYLRHDTLTFECEIGICSGEKIEEVVESTIYDENFYSASNLLTSSERNQTKTPASSSLKSDKQTVASASSSVKEALFDLYQNKKFCDVTIQTKNSSFPVHKNVLCARSLVFSAMFDADLKERRSGIIEILDLTDDTIQRMLMFMYSDTVKDLEWDSAMKLYFAANKYDIVHLRNQCAMFLKSNMNVSNVTDILVLADQHQDEDLKSASYDFILENDLTVFSSDFWKEFMENNLQLAAETTQLIFKKKLEKSKV